MRNTLLALLVAAPMVLAQTATAPRCPVVKIQAPKTAKKGESFEIKVTVTGGDESVRPSFSWLTSDGVISSGQGTAKIKVDTTEMIGNAIVSIVNVSGYDRGCTSITDNATTVIVPKR
jgi:hypothetical protein